MLKSPHSATFNAIIFDHDGTLVDSEPVHHHCWQATLRPYGVTLTREAYQQKLSGQPTIVSARWLVATYALTVKAETLYQSKMQAIAKHLCQQPFPLMPGALELLDWLQTQPYLLGIASGASLSEVGNSLSAHGLTHHFGVVATRDHVTANKPAPDVYRHAAIRLGVEPAQCLAIEDSDSGQRSAVAANMRCLRIRSHTTLENDPLCSHIDSLSDIRCWLENLA